MFSSVLGSMIESELGSVIGSVVGLVVGLVVGSVSCSLVGWCVGLVWLGGLATCKATVDRKNILVSKPNPEWRTGMSLPVFCTQKQKQKMSGGKRAGSKSYI